MRSVFEVVSIVAALSLLLSACGAGDKPPASSVAHSGLSRIQDPSVPQDDVNALIQGNNAFALDMYKSLRSGDGNLAFSPYSISLALAMTYAGARGTTEQQMAQVLHYTLPQERLHPAFNRLDEDLAQEAKPTSDKQQPLQLKIANAVWAEQTYSFLQSYLDLVATNYGAGVQLADFVNRYDAVRQQINSWVSQQTNDKIQDLIPQGALDRMTRMVLVNAIYFKADWLDQFDPNDTRDQPFNLLDGKQVQVKTMFNTLNLAYMQGDGFQAVEVPYVGETAAMDIIVPDASRFQDMEASLDAQKFDAIVTGMQPTMVELGLPKFSYRSSFSLSRQLSAMGMPEAFNGDRADFTGMSNSRDLYISEVLHQAFVAVDEKGTEAAAATAVIMRATAAMQAPQRLLVDRPFIYVIRDLKSGQILFIGRVMDPTK